MVSATEDLYHSLLEHRRRAPFAKLVELVGK
jgi:hypothetical protein